MFAEVVTRRCTDEGHGHAQKPFCIIPRDETGVLKINNSNGEEKEETCIQVLECRSRARRVSTTICPCRFRPPQACSQRYTMSTSKTIHKGNRMFASSDSDMLGYTQTCPVNAREWQQADGAGHAPACVSSPVNPGPCQQGNSTAKECHQSWGKPHTHFQKMAARKACAKQA
jgi:hypothetical protein